MHGKNETGRIWETEGLPRGLPQDGLPASIAGMWREYLLAAVPRGASQVQIQETRRAFFSGAETALLLSATMGSSGASEDECVRMFEGFIQECRDQRKLLGSPEESRVDQG